MAGQVDARLDGRGRRSAAPAAGCRDRPRSAAASRGPAARRAPGPRPAAAGCPRAWPQRRRPARRASPVSMNAAAGSATSIRPSAAISNTPTSSVEPKRFLLERSRRRPEKRSPSSVSTTSTRCSSVLGPASVPSLVTWPTRITGTAVFLGVRLEARRGRANLADGAGRALELVGGQCLDRVDDQQRRRGRLGGSDDALDATSRAATSMPSPRAPLTSQAEARGAQSDLGRRLLARRVQDAPGGARRAAPHSASTSVDLPIPGSPPRRTSEPGTRPPPSTRSTLAHAERDPFGVSRRSVAERSCRRRGDGARATSSRRELPRSTGVSTRVFHSPHERHCPSQRRLVGAARAAHVAALGPRHGGA